jgi:hypothetical protein
LPRARRGGNMRLLQLSLALVDGRDRDLRGKRFSSDELGVWFRDRGANQVETSGESAKETDQPDRGDAADAPPGFG